MKILIGLISVGVGVLFLLHDYMVHDGGFSASHPKTKPETDDPTQALHFAGFGIAILGIIVMTS